MQRAVLRRVGRRIGRVRDVAKSVQSRFVMVHVTGLFLANWAYVR